jgi:hypothetical protein
MFRQLEKMSIKLKDLSVKYAYLSVMAEFREEMEAKALLHSSCSTASLSRIASGNKSLDQATDLTLFIESCKGLSPSEQGY